MDAATGGDGRIRDDGSWTGGRRLRNGRICDGRGLCDGRTASSAAVGDEDDGADERRRGGRRGEATTATGGRRRTAMARTGAPEGEKK